MYQGPVEEMTSPVTRIRTITSEPRFGTQRLGHAREQTKHPACATIAAHLDRLLEELTTCTIQGSTKVRLAIIGWTLVRQRSRPPLEAQVTTQSHRQSSIRTHLSAILSTITNISRHSALLIR